MGSVHPTNWVLSGALSKIVSGSFTVLSGTHAYVLSGLSAEGVKAGYRIVGFDANGGNAIVVYY